MTNMSIDTMRWEDFLQESEDRTERNLRKCWRVLRTWKQIFSMLTILEIIDNGHLCSNDAMQHQIKLIKRDKQPIHSAPYQSRAKSEIFQKENDRLNAHYGNFWSCPSKLASPIGFISKKDGKLHTCLRDQKFTQWPSGTRTDSVYSLTYCVSRLSDDIFDIWRHLGIFASRNSQRRSRQDSIYVLFWPFWNFTHTFWIERRLTDVRTSEGRPTYESQEAVCPCKFRRQCKISGKAGRTCRTCSTSSGLNTNFSITLKLKTCEFSTKGIDYLVHFIHSGASKCRITQFMRIADFNNPQSWQKSGHSFVCANDFRPFEPSFAVVAAQLSNNRRRGQVQTSDRLAESR